MCRLCTWILFKERKALTGLHRAIPDPYIWHRPGMTSTWEFGDYRGRLNYALALFAWNDALNEAVEHIELPITQRRTWSESAGSETVDLDLTPLQGMSWSMLAEAATGAALVNRGLKDYHFIIRAERPGGEKVAVGFGRMTTQRNLKTEDRKKLDIRDVVEKSIPASRMTTCTPSLAITTRPFHDPFIYHEAGMISTWEFYGFARHASISPGVGLSAWRLAQRDAMQRVQAGHGEQEIGTQTRSWSAISRNPATRVDLILVPRQEMTWAVLAEAIKGAERLICGAERGFYFIVFIPGIEEEVAYGQLVLADPLHGILSGGPLRLPT